MERVCKTEDIVEQRGMVDANDMADTKRAMTETLTRLYDHRKEAGALLDLLDGEGKITPLIEKGVQKILERVNGRIMEDDPFFAYFYLQLDHQLRTDIASPTASNFKGGRYCLYINPYQFLPLPMEQMKNAIKHEILHILLQHMSRANILKKSYDSYVVNLAMDAVVNNYLQDMPRDAITVPYLNERFSLELKPFRTLEYYASKLQAAYDQLKADKDGKDTQSQEADQEFSDIEGESDQDQGGDPVEYTFNAERTHDVWDESDPLSDKDIEAFTQEYIEKANHGHAEGYLGSLIQEFYQYKSDLPWHHYLKKLMGTIEVGHKKTMTRRNRRQPSRLDLRGSIRNHKARVVVALDTSGSITGEQFREALMETLQILKAYQHDLIIVECDNQIQRSYYLKTMKDLETRLEGRGGTAFSPVVAFANDKQADLLIYFTDGAGEEHLDPLPKGYKILWVLTHDGDLSLVKPYGLVKPLENKTIASRFEGDVDEEIARENNRGGFSMANQEKFFEWSEEFLDRRHIVSNFRDGVTEKENPRI